MSSGAAQDAASPQQEPILEADPSAEGDESDYESLKSDVTSANSSIFNYQFENGRRYHAYQAGKYMLPNDVKEQERLDVQHYCFWLALGGEICRTKLENPQKILDVGTGTGLWATQIGEDFPSAQVIGTDLSPIQPTWVPPNVEFIVDDASQEWMFPKDSFDFIHARCLAGSIRDWPAFVAECYRHLKPGGRLELTEVRGDMNSNDGTLGPGSYTKRWLSDLHKIAHENGFDFDPFPKYRQIVEDAGFAKVDVDEVICPCGTWPKDPKKKELGKFFRLQFLEGAADSYSLAIFTRYGGWTDAEIQVLLAQVRNEIKNNKIHSFTYCSFLTAEKPLKS